MSADGDLDEQVVAVVGGPAGMARECAEQLRRRGAIVSSGATLDDSLRGIDRPSAIVVAPAVPDGSGSAGSTHLVGIGAAIGDAVRTVSGALEVLRTQGCGRLVLVGPGPAFPVPRHPGLMAFGGALYGLVRSLGADTANGHVVVNGVAPLVDAPPMTRFFDEHPQVDRRRFRLDGVLPLVAYLVDERCTSRGEIFSAGGGRVARVGDVTAAGAFVLPGDDAVAASIDRIRSLDAWLEPRGIFDELLLVEV